MPAPISLQTKALIKEAVRRYEREYDRYQKMAEQVHLICRNLVRDNAIRATTQARAKDPSRLEGKLERLFEKATEEERRQLDSADAIMRRVGDLAGVRIATYVEDDRQRVVEEIRKAFVGADGKSMEPDHKDGQAKCEHYRATHCQVALKDEDLSGTLFNLRGTTCEIQVCSLLAHVFNEIEHDLGYKALNGALGQEEKRWLDALAGVTKQGDQFICFVLQAVDARLAGDTQSDFGDPFAFVVRVRSQFPSARAFDRYHAPLYQDLSALGFRGPRDLKRLLTDGYEKRAQEQLAELKLYLAEQGLPQLDLDPDSSDLLLMLLLDHDCQGVLDLHKDLVGQGKGGPPRIYRIARFYRDCFQPEEEEDAGRADDSDGDDDSQPVRAQRPQYNFQRMGLPVGQEMVFVNPDAPNGHSTTVAICGPRQVKLRGRECYLSNATVQLLGGPPRKRMFAYWKYGNRSLQEIYNEKYLG
jgi:ppGpp synthetase/RelA/SpoT-type nucleotidyltranferase